MSSRAWSVILLLLTNKGVFISQVILANGGGVVGVFIEAHKPFNGYTLVFT